MTERGMYEVCVRVAVHRADGYDEVHRTVVVHADGFDEAEYMASENVKQDADVDKSIDPEVLWVVPVKYDGE